MRAARLPAVKTPAQFDFAIQPSVRHEQIGSLYEFDADGCRRDRLPAHHPGESVPFGPSNWSIPGAHTRVARDVQRGLVRHFG